MADKAYNNYEIEDVLATAGIDLHLMCKETAKRSLPPWWGYLQVRYCDVIETTSNHLQRLLPKSIHATTAQGFELKVVLFVLATSFRRLLLLQVATWVRVIEGYHNTEEGKRAMWICGTLHTNAGEFLHLVTVKAVCPRRLGAVHSD